MADSFSKNVFFMVSSSTFLIIRFCVPLGYSYANTKAGKKEIHISLQLSYLFDMIGPRARWARGPSPAMIPPDFPPGSPGHSG